MGCVVICERWYEQTNVVKNARWWMAEVEGEVEDEQSVKRFRLELVFSQISSTNPASTEPLIITNSNRITLFTRLHCFGNCVVTQNDINMGKG